MNEVLTQLIASKHWPYVWPCYVLAVLTFGGLAARAILELQHWKKRARDDESRG